MTTFASQRVPAVTSSAVFAFTEALYFWKGKKIVKALTIEDSLKSMDDDDDDVIIEDSDDDDDEDSENEKQDNDDHDEEDRLKRVLRSFPLKRWFKDNIFSHSRRPDDKFAEKETVLEKDDQLVTSIKIACWNLCVCITRSWKDDDEDEEEEDQSVDGSKSKFSYIDEKFCVTDFFL